MTASIYTTSIKEPILELCAALPVKALGRRPKHAPASARDWLFSRELRPKVGFVRPSAAARMLVCRLHCHCAKVASSKRQNVALLLEYDQIGLYRRTGPSIFPARTQYVDHQH